MIDYSHILLICEPLVIKKCCMSDRLCSNKCKNHLIKLMYCIIKFNLKANSLRKF